MKRLLLQSLLLAAVGSVVGVGANALSPRTAPLGRPVQPQAETTPGACAAGGGAMAFADVPRITVAAAKPLCADCSAGFVDARGEEEFTQGHVAGAIHLPPGDVPPAVLEQLRGHPTVVVYDGDPGGFMAEAVAMGLRELGVRDVRVLEGSWPAWMAEGGPGTSGPCALCADAGARR